MEDLLSIDEAKKLIDTAERVELVSLLGRWRSEVFSQFLKADMTGYESEGDSEEDGVSEDEERAAAIRTGKWWDIFRSTKVVSKKEAKTELLYSLTWSQPITHSTPPTPRSGHSMTAIGRFIYIFGGTDGVQSFNNLYVFDIESMTWYLKETKGDLPSPRQRHAAVALQNDTLLIFGGNGADNTIHILDCYAFGWSIKVSRSDVKPSARWGHSMTLIGNLIFLVGGHSGFNALDEVWTLDITHWTWTQLVSPVMTGTVPSAGSRHSSTGILATGKIVVLGGSATNTFKDIHELDTTHYRWYQRDTVGQMPPTRSHHSAVLIDKNILVFGGAGSGKTLNDVYIYNTATMRWSEPKIGGKIPVPRMDHSAVVISDEQGVRVFVFGGYDGQRSLNDMHILLTLTWGELHETGQCPSNRVGHSLTIVGENMILLGGTDPDGGVHNDVLVYNLKKSIWSVPTVTGLAPRALVSHSACLLSREIFIFGGGDGLEVGNVTFALDCEKFNWECPLTEGKMPTARYGHAACLEGTKMFVFGGFEVGKGYDNTLYCLDTTKLSWSTPYVNGLTPSPRVCHSMTLVGKDIIIFGGSADDDIFGEVHVLDTQLMIWSQPQIFGKDQNHTLYPRYLHTAVAVSSKLFIYGGVTALVMEKYIPKHRRFGWKKQNNSWLVNDLFVLDVSNMNFEQPNIAGEGPGARARHASTVWGSKVIVYGGKSPNHKIFTLDTGLSVLSSMNYGPSRVKLETSNETTSVQEWLAGLGLDKYTQNFIDAEIDMGALAQLTDEDLKIMGIEAVGPRKKLLTAISFQRGIQNIISSNSTINNKSLQPSAIDLYQHRYRLEGSVVYAGMGSVKIATDIKTDKTVVLKFITDSNDFDIEVSVFKRLRSEYFVNMFGYYKGSANSPNCIVFEYSTQSLNQFYEGRELTPTERKTILERIGRIIEFCHTCNIVIGDLKTSSICLFGAQWKLVDISSARACGSFVSKTIPHNCSPEFAMAVLNNQIPTLKAHFLMDIWSFGVIFAEMFGIYLFRAKTEAGLLKLVSEFQDTINFDKIDDIQAQHLLKKMLRRVALDRTNIIGILSHAYFVGGVDTEQQNAVFEFAKTSQENLKTKLSAIKIQLEKLKTNETKLKVAEQQKLMEEQKRIQIEIEKENEKN